MTNGEISLTRGAVNAHQTFEIPLGDNLIRFEINYKTLYGAWSVDLLRAGVRIVNGAMLQPGTDIIANWNLRTTIGRLVFTGDEPTLDNLGSANHLVWVPPV